jgi:hypothetical protein
VQADQVKRKSLEQESARPLQATFVAEMFRTYFDHLLLKLKNNDAQLCSDPTSEQ